ncbi:MAG: LytR family transcriptional regulator [Acidimicrobiia bacterium]|nr:LytR family transcriptional regulator [Acidimicrobiia bacterium]
MRYGRWRRGRKRTWRQLLVVVAGLLVFATAAAGAAGLGLVRSQVSQIPRVGVGLSLDIKGIAPLGGENSNSKAENFLVVGIDSAAGIESDSPIHIDRDINSLLTDSMILVRIDPGADRVAMLSIPRDLWVPIAGKGWSERVNAARGIGGPATLIETVSEYLGVPIHHYVEINFAGFLRVVEAIDGVPVEIEQPIRDDSLGLRIEQAGVVTLDPDTALSYVRTRRPLTLVTAGDPANDRDWVRLGVWNDLERNQRQQDFIVAILRRAVEQGIRNPFTLRRVINEVLDDDPSIVLDDVITLGQLISLGNEFRSFPVDQIERYELPVIDAVVDGKQVLLLDKQALELRVVLDFFGIGSLASIRVRVLNGTPLGSVVGVESQLEQVGFSVVERRNAANFDVVRTNIRYDEGSRQQALLLAQYMQPTPLLKQVGDDDMEGADVELVVGADLDLVLSSPSCEEPLPADDWLCTTRR